MSVINFNSYLESRIAKHREEMQCRMMEARVLIDQAVEEGKCDFTKIQHASRILDKAVEHAKEIKRLTAVLEKDSTKFPKKIA